LEAARVKVIFYYWPVPFLVASASAILFAISAFIASRLKLAPRSIGDQVSDRILREFRDIRR
jgi:hypothetical protein